jgi:hypothetical protein
MASLKAETCSRLTKLHYTINKNILVLYQLFIYLFIHDLIMASLKAETCSHLTKLHYTINKNILVLYELFIYLFITCNWKHNRVGPLKGLEDPY